MDEVTIEDGMLVIRLKLNDPLIPSKTGKSLLVASTGGFQPTGVKVNGKPVKANVMAIIAP